MKIWFVLQDGVSKGPFNLQDLKDQGILKESLVWKEGLSDWVQAKSRPELIEIFGSHNPPTFSNTNSDDRHYSNTNYTKSSGMAENLGYKIGRNLRWIVIFLVIAVLGYFLFEKYNSETLISPFSSEKSPQELRAELAESEKQNPSSYLSARAGQRRNIIGETVLEGTITNNASIAVFKDVILKVDFLSKTQSTIMNNQFTIYEVIEPGKTVNFKIKTLVPKSVRDFQFYITGATPIN